jgi:hypothetical protein
MVNYKKSFSKEMPLPVAGQEVRVKHLKVKDRLIHIIVNAAEGNQ